MTRKQPEAIDVLIDYASDDSCQIHLWTKGHYPIDEFIKACESALVKWDGRKVDLTSSEVKQLHWRTVQANAEIKASGVCNSIHVESKPGRGAYPVTTLEDWQPLHLY